MEGEQRVRFERIPDEAPAPTPRSRTPRTVELPGEVMEEISDNTTRRQAPRVTQRLADAAAAYERGRYGDARRMVKAVLVAAPESKSAAELHALCQYRLGYYRAAARELETILEADHSYAHHPVLADCYRAMGRHSRVRRVWDELREASPSPELMAEGRIVMAGSLADKDELREAIALLEKAVKPIRKPREHHLRTWFVLADLYERAGDVSRARVLFTQVRDADPEMADVEERLRHLS